LWLSFIRNEFKKRNGKIQTKHGHNNKGKRTPTYISWHMALRQRCFNTNNQDYTIIMEDVELQYVKDGMSHLKIS
jgi:hypothetical protein